MRCHGCNTQLDPVVGPEDNRHAWHTYWAADEHLCKACFLEDAAARVLSGDWPRCPHVEQDQT